MIVADSLGFEIFADDKASKGLSAASGSVRKLAADVETAQVRVAKATAASGAAQEKYGKDSLQARDALAKLAQAEVAAEHAAEKLRKGTRTASTQLEDTGRSASKLRGHLAKVGEVAGGIFAERVVSEGFAKFQELVSSSIEASSNLGESFNAVQKVFGSYSADIEKFGSTAATQAGLSQRAFQEMATPLGAMLKNAGLDMQDTTRWTIDLTKRAADMASVFGGEVTEALDAIQAGLRGESDPLEKYGVGLSAAATQAEALAETHKAAASALTNSELATARLNLIMKQTSATAGDFVQTSGGLANSQRSASAEFENAKAKLGTQLVPVLAKATQLTAELVTGFASMSGPMQVATAGAVALSVGVLVLGPRVVAAKKALAELGGTTFAAGTKMRSMSVAVGKVGVALAAAQVAGAMFSKDVGTGADAAALALQEYARGGKLSTAVTADLNETLTDLADKGYAGFNHAMNDATESLFGLRNIDFGPLGEGVGLAEQRIASLDAGLTQLVSSGSTTDAAAAFARIGEEAAKAGVSTDRLKQLFPNYENALAGIAAKQNLATSATNKGTTSVEKQAASQKKLVAALDASNNAYLQMRGGVDGYEAAIDAVTSSLKDNGKTMDVHTEKGRANRQALDSLATSALDYLSVMRKQKVPADQFNSNLDKMRQKLYESARRLGLGREAARKYVEKLLDIPHQVSTRIRQSGISSASNSLDGLMRRLNWVDGRTVTFGVVNSSTGRVDGIHRAKGGWVPGAPSSIDTVPAMLAGSEFVVNAAAAAKHRGVLEAINSGASITGPSGAGRSLGGPVGASGGSTYYVTVNMPFGSTQSDVEAGLTAALRKITSRHGGEVQTAFGGRR